MLLKIFTDLYAYHIGLKKMAFLWYKLPKGIEVVACTDSSGLFIYNNSRYYVSADIHNNVTVLTIERQWE